MAVEPGSEEDIADLDLFYRDPDGLNSNGRILFHDVIGEPEGAHSPDWAYKNAYRGYYVGKKCCYRVLTALCAVPLGFCWGCQFACTTFTHIWYVTPCFYHFSLNFSCAARFFATLVHCCCDPVFESVGLVFTRMYLHSIEQSEAYTTARLEDLNQLKQVVVSKKSKLDKVYRSGTI